MGLNDLEVGRVQIIVSQEYCLVIFVKSNKRFIVISLGLLHGLRRPKMMNKTSIWLDVNTSTLVFA